MLTTLEGLVASIIQKQGFESRVPGHRSGPDIHVPSAWQVPRDVARIHPGECNVSSQVQQQQHALYHAQQERWMNQAYRSPPSETITLEISALHEGGPRKGHMHATPFRSICEGMKDIDARATAPKLASIALAKVTGKIMAFCPEFLWRPKEFVVRDSSWVDLASFPEPMQPYFYNECLHAASRKNSKTMVFKPKQFSLFVVVPEAQWREYENYANKLAEDAMSTMDAEPNTGSLCRPNKHSVPAPIPASSSSFNTSLAARPLSHSLTHASDEVCRSVNYRTSSSMKDLFLATASDFSGHSVTDAINVDAPATSLKRKRSRSVSMSSTTTHSPPGKRTFATAASPTTPSRHLVKEALQVGGSANVDIGLVMKTKLDSIIFYPIPTLRLEEILNDTDKHAFSLNHAKSFSGQLHFDTSSHSLLGVGGFKTAHHAYLLLNPMAPSGLGSLPRHPVVLKRPYHGGNSANKQYKHYVLAQELPLLFWEVNVLYWAKSLLQMTYEYINLAIRDAADISIPVWIANIPHLHFVEAGLALIYSTTSKGPSTSTGSVVAAYLLEEKIECGDSKFTKFIHNVQYSSLLEPDHDAFHIAEFLVFTQHIQYMKTDSLAYISDYQGNTTLLTDPQILTHLSVGGGMDIFSKGNVEIGVELFEQEHVCNRYCTWPGFVLKPFKGSE
ncbi:hypothetical protein M404DRAFT_135048 [Pisolithus tinctorius Marx 270]|uniref:Alpha-type protein kinase domain-containing protein n=1 Tax=Pisolithus tinctorius Marx 270 TaxID=870435 RepID=A0A0C3JG26_PISTI|nr:hypothetical protein M404DRAFT_135048 [Pisolithus tinctorius Marx 270]